MVSVGVSGYGNCILVMVEGWGVGARSGATCLKFFIWLMVGVSLPTTNLVAIYSYRGICLAIVMYLRYSYSCSLLLYLCT